MMRILITRGVGLGGGKTAAEGEEVQVEDHLARVLIHAGQARVADAPASGSVPNGPDKKEEDPQKAGE